MKRILIVNNVGFFINGITSVIMNYYYNMQCDDYEFEFLSASPYEERIEEEFSRHHVKHYFITRNKRPIKYMISLFRLCKKRRYDIIHVHGNSATMTFELLPAWMAGVKTRIAHSHNSRCEHKKLHKILSPLFGKLYTHAFACSNLAGEWIFGKDNFEVIINGFNTKEFIFDDKKRKENRKRMNLEDRYVIGHVGCLNYQKNQEFLINIIKKLAVDKPSICLLLVGSGLDETILRQQILESNLEDKVILYGNSNDIQGLLSAMDIFVFPSRYEGLGIALVEAQINGLSCIASEYVPSDVVISDKIDFLPISYTGISLWIDKILENMEMHINRKEIYEYTKGLSDKFDIERCAYKLLKIYSKGESV